MVRDVFAFVLLSNCHMLPASTIAASNTTQGLLVVRGLWRRIKVDQTDMMTWQLQFPMAGWKSSITHKHLTQPY